MNGRFATQERRETRRVQGTTGIKERAEYGGLDAECTGRRGGRMRYKLKNWPKSARQKIPRSYDKNTGTMETEQGSKANNVEPQRRGGDMKKKLTDRIKAKKKETNQTVKNRRRKIRSETN